VPRRYQGSPEPISRREQGQRPRPLIIVKRTEITRSRHKKRKGAGSRQDVQAFQLMLKAGRNDLELMDADFSKFSRFIKTVDRYRTYVPPVRTTELKVALFVGKPGTGKTRQLMPFSQISMHTNWQGLMARWILGTA